MLIEKLQMAAVIVVTIMFMIVCALLLETTIVTDCENCNKLFHNFSTTCTANKNSWNLLSRLNQEEVIVHEEEVKVASVSLAFQDLLQTNTVLQKNTSTVNANYLNEITYIGDSRFVGLLEYGIDQSNVFAKSGLNHIQALTQSFVELPDGSKVTLVDALAQNQNDIILINFGVNGAGWFGTDEFIDNYNELLDLVIANTDNVAIVIQSILPIANSYEYKENGFPNTRIDELNEYLLEIAYQRGLYYLDSSYVLKDENNYLATKYTNDGLHFNNQAYEMLLQHIQEYSVFN